MITFLANLNAWRWSAVILGVYFAVATYTSGWLTSLVVAGFIFSIYQLGYMAACKDIIFKHERQ